VGKLKRSTRNIRWIESYCRVPEGRLVGQPVKLRKWQREEIARIYDNPAVTRRAILSFGRKNGKTALSAMLLLLHLCGPEAVENGQLYSAAQSRDQAAILFGLAAKMVRMNPELHLNSGGVVGIRDTAKELYVPDLGTRYKALSAEASTAYGLSPVFVVHDELGQVRGSRSELYEAIETAMGAQDRPLSIVISTQAPNPDDLLSLLIDDAKEGADPRVTLALYEAQLDCALDDEAAIRAANPAFGDFQNAAETLAMAQDAMRMPSRENEFRNLILNQRVETQSPFVSRSNWHACLGDVPEYFSGPVYLGMDLSKSQDLTAAVALGAAGGGRWFCKSFFWLPEDGLREKSQDDRFEYLRHKSDGWLMTTPGPTVEYRHLAEWLWGFCQDNDVRRIAYDRYNIGFLKPWALDAGFDERDFPADGGKDSLFVAHGQGFKDMSPAVRALEGMILRGDLIHDGSPVLEWCMANATTQTDPAENRKLVKPKGARHRRIDGAVALAMAAAMVPLGAGCASGPSYLETEDLVVL